MCLGKGLPDSSCVCFEVWTLCFGASDLLSTGSTSPVSCFEPGSGLAGQTHQLASFKPQEVASVEKKKMYKQRVVSFRPSEQITGAQSPKIDLSFLSLRASGSSGKCFA